MTPDEALADIQHAMNQQTIILCNVGARVDRMEAALAGITSKMSVIQRQLDRLGGLLIKLVDIRDPLAEEEADVEQLTAPARQK